MAGLLGMGGLGGAFGGPNTGKLSGPLAQLFNPTSMRNSQIKKGLLNAGIAMMNPDPHAPPAGIGGILGRAAAGGLQGADQAKQDYMQDGMFSMQLQEMQREQDQRAQQAAALDAFRRSPEYAQLDGISKAYIDAYPEQGLEAWMKAKTGANGPEYYAPQLVEDGSGNYAYVQPNKGPGSSRQMELPKGYKPAIGMNYIDRGPDYAPVPQKGTYVPQNIAPIPKDLAGAEREKKIGQGEGEAQTAYISMTSKMPGLEQVVSELRNVGEQATYTGLGQMYNWGRKELGMDPTESAVARTKYIAMVDNQILPLLRDTFGAQFTVQEGESLRATLGDPNKTPQEKQEVLEAFIEQKRRDVEALALQAIGRTPGAGASGAADPLGIR
jgi:hypothetical protein